jgi:thioredoxin reductase (NADPH)
MTSNSELDVLIIGGGPAGISALIWCRELGLSSILIDAAPELGGQLLSIYNAVNDYPGISAINGAEIRDRFFTSIDLGAEKVLLDSRVDRFDAEKVTVFLSNGSEISARFAVIATGLRRRKLGIPGEDRFTGRGILASGSRERESVRGKRVAVVGGGDAAVENALILSEFADRVYLIHRRDRLSARNEFIDKVKQANNVEIIYNAFLTSIGGQDAVRQIRLTDSSNQTTSLNVDFVLVRVGYQPNSELVKGQVQTDRAGYIVTNRDGQTTAPQVFAVGDVANPVSPTIATAVGSAATAVKAIYSLIGEDSRL